MRAYSYIRLSSKLQTKGTGTERQMADTLAYCERNGLTLDDTFRLQDLGVSGFNGKNVKEGALKHFLDAVAAGRIPRGSVLIIESIDRLSRDQITDALMLFMGILKSGVEIVTLKPERRYSEASVNDLGNLLEPLVYMSRAWEESYIKSTRLQGMWSAKRNRIPDGFKITKRCPYWLRLADDRKRYEVIPPYVETVKMVYRLALKGLGTPKIVKHLRDHKVPTFEGGRRGERREWNIYYVNLMLRTRTVLGEYQPYRYPSEGGKVAAGEPVKDYYPAIIDEDTYYRVQEVMGRRNKHRNRGRRETHTVNIFRGLLYDARTGEKMMLAMRQNGPQSGGRQYKYKLISQAGFAARGTAAGGFRLEHLEPAFLRFVREIRPDEFADHNPAGDMLTALSARLASLDARIKAVKDRIKSDDAIEPLLDALTALHDERTAVQGQLEQVQASLRCHKVEALGEAQGLISELDNANDPNELRERIRAKLRQLIESVWVLIWDENGARRLVGQANFHDGTRRYFRAGYSLTKHPFTAWTENGYQERWSSNIPGFDLRDFRTSTLTHDDLVFVRSHDRKTGDGWEYLLNRNELAQITGSRHDDFHTVSMWENRREK